MSFQAMAWAVNIDLPMREKMVLLMLANYASNERGDCYPSINTLAKDCGAGKDTIIRSIKSLEEAGYLTIVRRMECGVNLPNIYTLNMKGVVAHSDHGSSSQRLGVVASCDSNLSIKPINNSSLRSELGKHTQKKPSIQSKLAEILNEDTAKAVIEHRKALKKPLTIRAAELLVKSLASAPQTCGLTPDQAADLMIYKGWQGFEPEWARNAMKSGYSPNHQPKETVRPDSELSEEVLEAEWGRRLNYARRNRTWFTAVWGAMPGKEGCRVPEHLLQPNDGKHPHGGNWIEQ